MIIQPVNKNEKNWNSLFALCTRGEKMLWIVCFLISFCPVLLEAQTAGRAQAREAAEIVRKANYKQDVKEILQDDELFVLFYLNLALVVDPTQETQVVEEITTANPWASLSKYLRGKSNIYFCPSGSQLSIAIEYMPCPLDEDVLMSDKYGMYRLSAPEELFENRGDDFKRSKHKAVVFGGLKYDEMPDYSKEDMLAFRSNREAVNGYNYLRSTYEEAIYIDSILRKNGIKTALLTGNRGTEENFAKIPDNHADILHIASHGSYDPNNDNLQSTSLQEWMMSHSWLVLSGANEEVVNGEYDGRITAYEISQTDLSGVNLVVLSACNTGLGDVKENDVYGLLKGFKKAGAGTILVSLSEVNDRATGLLMKRFYDNLFRGDNPRRALENAQRYLRLYGDGRFNKPEYWASFILVDDLDRNVGTGVSDECKQAFLSEIIHIDELYSKNDLFPNWEKIREVLKPDEAIVRVCPYIVKDTIADYVAMIGNPLEERCHVIRLFSTSETTFIGSPKDEFGYQYKLSSLKMLPFEYLDSVLWKPILPYVGSAHKLYCHFSGIAYWFPFESLPSVMDDYRIYRLSSLNMLCDSKEKFYVNDSSLVALFGGLNYDEAEPGTNGFPEVPFFRGIAPFLYYLYGTKIETDEIAKILYESHYKNVKLYQDSKGTESVLNDIFKNDSLRILHLASHSFGFDYSHPTNNLLSIRKKYSIIDYLLDCSGIPLSGANESFVNDREIIQLSENDNILSGSEIINNDLSKLSLLVLSTCQKGADEELLTTCDSHWNMVKAFKLAGTKTILHALWSIEDESTAILMTNFYKNIVDGYNLIKALELAKQSIRSHTEKGWNDPKYWASFVLIDAFE